MEHEESSYYRCIGKALPLFSELYDTHMSCYDPGISPSYLRLTECGGWWLGLGELYTRASEAELFTLALSCRKLNVYQLESEKLS